MPLIKCKNCGALFPQATPNSKCSICGGELTGIISSKKAPMSSNAPYSPKQQNIEKVTPFGTEAIRGGFFNSSTGKYEDKMTLPASAFSAKLTHNKERIQTETPVVEINQLKKENQIQSKQADIKELNNQNKQQTPVQQPKKQEKKQQVKEPEKKEEKLENSLIIQNRYKIIRPIKRGGMGAIYEVLDKRLHKNWALKEMMETFDNEQECNEARERFEREATLLASLTHPNLPRVIDFFDEKGKFYLVMDYIAGKDLNDILKKQENRRLPLEQVFRIIADILDILDYLHHRNPPIIYRDIKPGNIMVRTEDSKTFLIDFGIARSIAPESTDPKTEVGTVGYAPPEQYTGNPMPCSDLYALGATMHELISGVSPKIPFQFQSLKDMLPNISDAINHVVLKALELDYHKRWQNAQEMLKAVNEIIDNEDYYMSSSKSKNIIITTDNLVKEIPKTPLSKLEKEDILSPKIDIPKLESNIQIDEKQKLSNINGEQNSKLNQALNDIKPFSSNIPSVKLPSSVNVNQQIVELKKPQVQGGGNQVFELHNSQSNAINQFISKTQSNLKLDKKFLSSANTLGMDLPIFDSQNVLSQLTNIKQPKSDFGKLKIGFQNQNSNELKNLFSEDTQENVEKPKISAPYIPERPVPLQKQPKAQKTNTIKQENINSNAEIQAREGIKEYCSKFKDPFIKTENNCFISDFQFNPQRGTVCLTDRKGIIKIKDLIDLKDLTTVQTGFTGISTFDFSSNGSYFAYNSQKSECIVMDSRSLSIIAKFVIKDSNIIKVLLHPSEPYVIIGCDDGTIVKCNYSNQEKLVFKYNKLPISAMTLSIDGHLLYTGHINGVIHSWSISENSIIAKNQLNTGKVNDLSVAQNNKLLVSCADDGLIILWKSDNLSPIKKMYEKQTGSVYSVSYATNKPYICTVSQDCSIRIWDLMTGTVNMQAYKNDTRINKIRIKSYKENTYIAASTDTAMLLWKK